MKELRLTAEILQDNVLFYAYGKSGCRVKAIICPIEGGFRAYIWEGDGKTSNQFDAVNPKIPSLIGFKPMHEGVIGTVLGCFIITQKCFENIGKDLTIILRDAYDQKDAVKKIGLSEYFTGAGFFCADKKIVKKSGSVPLIRKWGFQLSDKLAEFKHNPKSSPLTDEEINTLRNATITVRT